MRFALGLSLASLALCLGCSSESSPSTAAPTPDAAAAVEAGASCVFNADCPSGLRCTCVDAACTCQVGARGAGKSGVDACASGDDCESGLCVEGAPSAGLVCSGPCAAGCGSKLPRCVNVAGLGEICAREPAASTGAVGKLSGKTWAFDKAYFGYDLSDAGPTATSLELQAGSDGSCPPPKKDPQATIVVAGLPGELAAQSYDVKATLLGLDPSLPIKSTATGVKLSLGNLEPCAPPVDRTCAFDATVTLTFAEGTVVGTVRAVHCDSMDAK